MSRPQFFLLPSLACQARCDYCLGPNRGPVMRQEVFDAALDWIESLVPAGRSVDITFHGGEPLLAGQSWYERALPRLRERFGRRLKLAIQSNLWRLRDTALTSLRGLRDRLATQPKAGLANAYLHVTYACNLVCAHCYARSEPGASPIVAVNELARLAEEAARAGFDKLVVTGGEPMAHPQRDHLLAALNERRERLKPLETVLRINLAYPLSPALRDRLAHSTDQVVVSVDKDATSTRCSTMITESGWVFPCELVNIEHLSDFPTAGIVLA